MTPARPTLEPPNRPQDEVQHWRRMRKALNQAKGDMYRGTLTADRLAALLTELRDLAQDRETVWINRVLSKEPRP